MNLAIEKRLSDLEELAIKNCKEQREAARIRKDEERKLYEKNLPREGEEIIYGKIEKKLRFSYTPCNISCNGCSFILPKDVFDAMKHIRRQ